MKVQNTIKKVIAILIFANFIISFNSLAQKQGQNRIDSLLAELSKAKEDTNKVNLLNSLSINLSNKNPDESFKDAEKALTLAKQLQWSKGIGSSYNNIGNYYREQGEFAKSLENQIQSLKFFEETGNKKLIASALIGIGNVYFNWGTYHEALKYYNNALKLKEEIGDIKGVANVYFNIGSVLIKQGNFSEALKNHLLALRYFEQLTDKRGIAKCYDNIGIDYWSMFNDTEALKNFQIALKLKIEIGDKRELGITYENIAGVYTETGKEKEAIDNYNTSIKIMEELGDKVATAMPLNNIGAVYYQFGDYPKAYKYYMDALKIREEIGDTDGLILSYGNIGEVFWKQKDYPKAENYLIKSIELAKQIGAVEKISSGNQSLSEIYADAGDYKKALICYKAFREGRDSIFNKQNTEKVVKIQMQYDFDKKQAAEKAETDKKMAVIFVENKRKVWLSVTIGLAIITLSFTGFYFRRKIEHHRFNNQILEIKQEALNSQMSDHFIGNTMSTINRFIKINETEKASKYLTMIDRLIRNVLSNAPKKMIPLNEDLEILKDYIELEKLQFKEGALSYEIVIDKDIDIDKTLFPPMIFQVLTENSIKHGFKKSEGGKVTVRIIKKENTVECIVEDNGIGRRKAKEMKSEEDSNKKSYGTGLAEKLIKLCSGLGEKSSYKIIDLLDGDKPSGTRVEFILPYIVIG